VTLFTARAAFVAMALAAAVRLEAASLEFQPIERLPPAVAALAAELPIEAFALAPQSSIAIVSTASSGEPAVSTLRYARGDEEPRVVPLAGRVLGLAVSGDGSACYAVVRVTGRRGAFRSIDLVRIDLRSGRASSVASLPATASGLALTSDDATLLVASKDELRTFSIPAMASGPLYRALGDNLGVFPIEGSSYVLVAQRSRVALIDLSAPQGRDGLELKEEVATPATLRGLLSSAGEGGPVALGEGSLAWHLRIGDLPAAPAVPPPPPPDVPPQEAVEETPTSPPPPVEAAPREISGDPGTVSGHVAGPGAADVAAVLFLGPDNILREALRVAPDGSGRYQSSTLPAGSYRVVAAGKGGRVLICSPPYVSIRVGSNSAVEAPELTVLRAQ
jgi:hypothetical protein